MIVPEGKQRHDEQPAATCSSIQHQLLQEQWSVHYGIIYSTWLFPSNQNTKSTTANHMCFLLCGVKQTLIRPGAQKELEL